MRVSEMLSRVSRCDQIVTGLPPRGRLRPGVRCRSAMRSTPRVCAAKSAGRLGLGGEKPGKQVEKPAAWMHQIVIEPLLCVLVVE